MIGIRHRLPKWRPLRARLLPIKRNLPHEIAPVFPRWLPLTLLWRPASRRTPFAASRGGTVMRFNSFTAHLHAQLKVFAATLLQRSFSHVHTPAKKMHSSGGPIVPPPPTRGAPSHAAVPAAAVSTRRGPVAAMPRVLELAAVSHQGPNLAPRRAALDLPEMRRAGAERPPMRNVSLRQGMPEVVPTEPLSVARRARPYSPVALAGRLPNIRARPRDSERRAKMTHVDFFSGAPELIWRKGPAPGSEEPRNGASHRQRIAGNGAIAAVSGAGAAGVTQLAPASFVTRRPTALSDLEPSLVDRLADDVIRRVERRARIERERRGL